MIVPFEERYLPHFERLNREWIERYFRIEAVDLKLFADPKKEILEPGGQIFFALDESGDVVGTAAAVVCGEGRYELAKMGVTEKAQGRGFGRQLSQAVIDFARSEGGRMVTLISNSRLTPAIALYERLGFHHRPYPEGLGYERGDVYMELPLTQTP